MLKVKQDHSFKLGYNPITMIDEIEDNTKMDFGILRLQRNQVEVLNESQKEIALLLISGQVTLEWNDEKKTIKRSSCFDETPWVLHVPRGVEVKATGVAEDSEICIIRTFNNMTFKAKLYSQEDCKSEVRGKGTLNECSTRIFRTAVGSLEANYSKLVIGEVVVFPGNWSSFPPHNHPEPEIYFYKFFPENGYGFAQLGEQGEMVKNNYTIKAINNLAHVQVTAPGYAMYYIWVMKHLDDSPRISPTFPQEHLWTNANNAKFWPCK